MKALLAAVLAGLIPTMAQAELQPLNVRFTCDRGVELPVVFVNETGGDSVAILYVEGQQNLLFQEPSASGARYGWPSDGSAYVLWVKGQEATVYWRDGEKGTETLIYTCTQAE
ncbi:hypothetical protein MASR2M74_28130 [Paracoccaceae bacterium]